MTTTTLIHRGERPAVRIECALSHAVERVWAALTVPAESARWFPSTLTVEPRVGGTVTFAGDPNTPDSAGTVLEYAAAQHLAFSWGTNELHFDLVAASPETCVLVLTDVLTHENEAARNAAGWDVCLAQLDVHLSGEEADGPHGSSAPSWQQAYDRCVAAGLPSGAPIPGGASRDSGLT
ncbi:SRPBCC family protein [Cryobacterium melibiosiphilum]|uniref:SRPBCC family protein n=1 Tax=Cryobacterium melibiosiphilum TaxID=995039 RepID=A0A3A5MUW4_9MICO|nr:SRPBCC family protein [Cryobacterium melibiosiphilum]RJT89796.1 SRPBCC family protein [Cryobacterium melibiosiphilum]